MKREDVVIGMKVVPHSKTGEIYPMDYNKYLSERKSDTSKFLKENGFLFVTKDKKEDGFLLNNNLFETGDYFLAEDFEPYVEPSVVEETDESDEEIMPFHKVVKTMFLIDKSELIRLREIEKNYKEITELLLKNAMKNAIDSLALYERLKV